MQKSSNFEKYFLSFYLFLYNLILRAQAQFFLKVNQNHRVHSSGVYTLPKTCGHEYLTFFKIRGQMTHPKGGGGGGGYAYPNDAVILL